MEKKIIWLTSYPKCGNTYLRSFLSHYIHDDYTDFTFENLKKIKKFETKETFALANKFVNNPNNYITHSLEVQKELIKKLPQKNLIYKTHHFFGSIDGYQFTSEKYTLLFIYLIRDPREVLVSYAKHSGVSIDEMLNIITNEKKIYRSGFQTLVSWGQNYRSWKSFKQVPSYFVKYEDLVLNPVKIFESIIYFISRYTNIPYDQKKIREIIELTTFDKLKNLEKKTGFDEAEKSIFFRSGKADSWKKVLNIEQIKTIEKVFEKEMKELKYI
tara:strand:+ start:2281 stop:3093 length:813 start_codon:yes stop_codon:yes gene_type:complete